MTAVYAKLCHDHLDYVTEDLDKIAQDCHDWVQKNRYDFHVESAFNHWVEDRPYPNTDEGEEQAWEDYAEYLFESGEWGPYSWEETCLK